MATEIPPEPDRDALLMDQHRDVWRWRPPYGWTTPAVFDNPFSWEQIYMWGPFRVFREHEVI